MTGDGTMLSRGETNHWWMPWKPEVGDNESTLAMLKSVSNLRRGNAKEYLVYGRMQRPAEITGIKTVHWESDGQVRNIPAVLHSAWGTHTGKFAIVLANWTQEPQSLTISDARLGEQVVPTLSTEEIKTRAPIPNDSRLALTLPPLSCMLVEKG